MKVKLAVIVTATAVLSLVGTANDKWTPVMTRTLVKVIAISIAVPLLAFFPELPPRVPDWLKDIVDHLVQ